MIIIDTREKKRKQIKRHLDRCGAEYRVDTCHHKADYVIDGPDGDRLGIQRKEVSDFVSSLRGDLKDHLWILRQHYEYSALLVEGGWGVKNETIGVDIGKTNDPLIVPVAQWHNFKLSQQLRGTLCLRTTCLKETCWALNVYDSYMDDPFGPPRSMPGDPEYLLYMFPGIGPELADRILESYDGNVRYAIEDIEGWGSISGIGPKTLEQIDEWLNP